MKKFATVYFKILPYYCGAFLAFVLYELYEIITFGSRDKTIVYITIGTSLAFGVIGGFAAKFGSGRRKQKYNSEPEEQAETKEIKYKRV